MRIVFFRILYEVTLAFVSSRFASVRLSYINAFINQIQWHWRCILYLHCIGHRMNPFGKEEGEEKIETKLWIVNNKQIKKLSLTHSVK